MKNIRVILELMVVDMDIYLKKPDTLPPTIKEKLLVLMGDIDIGPIPATINTKEEIVGLIVQDVEVGIKISDTLPCSMLDKVLMVMGEVDIGLTPALIPPIMHVILVYHQGFIVMVMTEVYIGLRPGNFLHITMV